MVFTMISKGEWAAVIAIVGSVEALAFCAGLLMWQQGWF